MAKILLTGPPGIGKTTIVQKVLRKVSVPVGGFYTSEIREKGRRVGFKVQGLHGEEDVMAHINFRGPRVGKYGVNVSAFDRIGPPAIDSALRSARLVVMDEIGKMELFSTVFQQKVFEALDADLPVLGVIKQHRNPFTDAIRNRPDVTVITVTQSNRDTLPDEIINQLNLQKKQELEYPR